MKINKHLKHQLTACVFLIPLLGCMHAAGQNSSPDSASKPTGKIFLYGEKHADKKILKKEIEIWENHYNEQGLRHLFIETPFYTAALLNLWMNSEEDKILDRIYDDWKGTANHDPAVKCFFKELKTRFPGTVFHGTDIGHQYQTTGRRYLDYLTLHSKTGSRDYQRAEETIEQGRSYYGRERDAVYRENMMVENFTREFSHLKGESVMGIYGAAHTGLESLAGRSKTVPSMANQLRTIYGDRVISKNLTAYSKDMNPLRVDSMQLNGCLYKALYFGRQDLSGMKDFEYRDFWRLEKAYPDFRMASKTGDVLPYSNYPMVIETNQVFVIDYLKTDGTSMRKYYRSDGKIWRNRPSTEEFIPK